MIDEATYRTWWPLHLRVVRGESLTAEEQVAYTAGLRHLHQEEVLREDVAVLHQTRGAVTALEAEQAQLRARQERLVLRTTNKVPVHNIDVTGLTVRERDTYLCRIALEAEIATLEAALSDSTRQILGAKG